MNTLDKTIKELFEKMISSPERISNIRDGGIEFDNGLIITAVKKTKDYKQEENKPLSLDSDTFSIPFMRCFSWDVITPDTDKLLFYIRTPYRKYAVPEHDRHAYVEVLDILENSISEFENRKLGEYISYFNKE